MIRDLDTDSGALFHSGYLRVNMCTCSCQDLDTLLRPRRCDAAAALEEVRDVAHVFSLVLAEVLGVCHAAFEVLAVVEHDAELDVFCLEVDVL